MKKYLAIALCLLIAALPFHAVAEDEPQFPFIDDPFEDRDEADFGVPHNDSDLNIRIVLNGVTHTLVYDSTPEYSNVKDGLVQASFYEYDSPSNTLYELFMVFPENVESDSTIDAQYAVDTGDDCSVVMIVSDDDTETYYVSGIMDGKVYPANSDFAMRFDFVTTYGGGTSYAGTLDANLVAVDANTGAITGAMKIDSAPFSLLMGGAESPDAPDDRDQDDAEATPSPTAAPSDLRKA
mgnify:CR=1 FL=1